MVYAQRIRVVACNSGVGHRKIWRGRMRAVRAFIPMHMNRRARANAFVSMRAADTRRDSDRLQRQQYKQQYADKSFHGE